MKIKHGNVNRQQIKKLQIDINKYFPLHIKFNGSVYLVHLSRPSIIIVSTVSAANLLAENMWTSAVSSTICGITSSSTADFRKLGYFLTILLIMLMIRPDIVIHTLPRVYLQAVNTITQSRAIINSLVALPRTHVAHFRRLTLFSTSACRNSKSPSL